MVNITLEVIISCFSIIPLLVVTSSSFKQYRQTSTSHTHYMMLIWFLILIKQVFEVLAVVFLNPFYMRIAVLCLIPVNFSVLLFTDILRQESVEPVKMIVLSALATETIHVIFAYSEISIIELSSGDLSVVVNLGLAGPVSVMSLFAGVFFFFNSIKIHSNAPSYLHGSTRLLMISSFLMGILINILTLAQITLIIPCIVRWTYSIAAILIVYVFKKEPEIAYVLPFQVTSLIVIDNKAGAPRYSFSWRKIAGMDHSLFSGLLHGVRLLMKETLDANNVNEISLDNGHLLLNTNAKYDFTVILYTTKVSKTLQNALEEFSARFASKFGQIVSDDRPLEDFRGASDLTKDVFWFIPDYSKRG